MDECEPLIAGTRSGITGIQLDCKPAGIPLDILVEALEAASTARQEVIDVMEKAIPVTRAKGKPTQPQFAQVKIPKALIGKLIGPGGKNIKELEVGRCMLIVIETRVESHRNPC